MTFKYVATTNGKERGISFYKFDFASQKDDWAKFVWNPLGQWFCMEKNSTSSRCLFLFRDCISLENGVTFHGQFEET